MTTSSSCDNDMTDPLDIDPWVGQSSEVLSNCILATSKSMMTAFASTRHSRRTLLIPVELTDPDSRRALHEHASVIDIKTKTIKVGGVPFVQLSHKVGVSSETVDVDVDGGDSLAACMGLSRHWVDDINPYWREEFVNYDTHHWSAIFMCLASTKTTEMIRYFGTRVCTCSYILMHVYTC